MPKKIQLLYISSANRSSGTPGDFVVRVESSLFAAFSDTERSQITCLDATMSRSWYTVDAPRNTFLVQSGVVPFTVTITPGYYDVYSFKRQVLAAPVMSSWSMTYASSTNKYTLTPPAGGTWTLSFPNDCSELLGFPVGAEISGTSTSPIVSLIPIRMNRESSVLIQTDLAREKNASCDNINDSDFSEGNILLRIPIDAAPFDNLTYHASSSDLYTSFITSQRLSSIRIWLTDDRGRPLNPLYDWSMCWRVEYRQGEMSFDDIADRLDTLNDSMRLLILNAQKINTFPLQEQKQKTAKR